MNTLINTPLLKSNSVRTEFDNKIIAIFLSLIIGLVISGLLFIDIMKDSSNPLPEGGNNPPSPQTQTTLYI